MPITNQLAPPIMQPQPDGMLPFGGADEPPEAQPQPMPEMAAATPALPTSSLGAEVPAGQKVPEHDFHRARMKAFDESADAHRAAAAANSDALANLDVNDPDYAKKLMRLNENSDALHRSHGELRTAKAQEELANPWGTMGNHPGIGGKIGHAFGVIGNVAGNALLGPGLMSEIPGTRTNLQAEAAGGKAEEKAATVSGEEAAKTGLETAQTGEAQAREESLRHPETKVTNDFELWRQQNPTAPVADWFKLQNEFKPDKPDTATQNKQAFQDVIGKMDAAGVRVNPTDYNKVKTALDEAQQRGLITPQEHSTAMGYLAANPTPGTNATINVNEKVAGEGIKEGAEFYAVNGKFMRGRDMTPEQRAEAVPVKDIEKAEAGMRSTNSTLGTFQRYKNTIDKANLTPDDIRALQVLTAPQAIAHSYLEKETGGVLDSLFGEPLTGYSEKAMGGIMTKDQYDKLSPDGQKALVGYYNSLIANFADMKQRLGGIGRNESMIQAEIHNIPLPYIGKDAADEAFNEKMNDITSRNIYMHGLNEQPKQNTAPTGGGELKPQKAADAGMKWQYKTDANGQVQWRQVPTSQ